MKAKINLPRNYMNALLSLNDEAKLRIINTLSESLLNHGIEQVVSVKPIVRKRRNSVEYPSDIQSLIGVAADIVADATDERLQYLLEK